MDSNTPSKAYYDFSKVFQATKCFIDDHNNRYPELTLKLNANHRATAELITRLYAKQLNMAISLGDTLESNLPGFRTYNSSLASCKGCTVRTIMNHKERLKASGFIIKETHHGKSGIELWINPVVFKPKKLFNSDVDLSNEATQKMNEIPRRVKNFHPLVHEQHEQENNNSSVDKLIKKGVRLSAQQQNRTVVTRTLQEQDKNTEKCPASASHFQTRRLKNADTPGADPAFLLQLVKDFWKYSKAVLYPGIVLSDPEETEILNLIWASVYRKFKVKGSKKDWKGYQEILYKRIDMVARWLERNHHRWIPPAHLYFHPENKRNGFNKTYQWFLKQEILKKEIRNQLLLQNAQKEWKDQSKEIGKHKHKTRLQLFQIQHKRLSRYKDEDLIKLYTKSLQHYVNS